MPTIDHPSKYVRFDFELPDSDQDGYDIDVILGTISSRTASHSEEDCDQEYAFGSAMVRWTVTHTDTLENRLEELWDGENPADWEAFDREIECTVVGADDAWRLSFAWSEAPGAPFRKSTHRSQVILDVSDTIYETVGDGDAFEDWLVEIGLLESEEA